MANINFNELQTIQNNQSSTSELPGFFTLSGDGDEAIVRFMHDSTDSFDIVSTHSITVNGKFRNINCIRDPREPLDKCPLCARGDRLNNRIYIHLVEYVVDPTTNQVVPKLRVWDRSLAYAQTLKNYLDNYGPLSDMICKIIRHGARGNMQTTYEIVPNLSKQVYPDNIYVKPANAFENYSAVGTAVMNKNYQEISYFVQNGSFPEPVANNSTPVQPVMSVHNDPIDPTGYRQINVTPVSVPFTQTDTPVVTINPPQFTPVQPSYTGTPNVTPSVTPVVNRPQRYY